VANILREDGFTLTEMMVSTTIVLAVVAAALQTFSQGLQVNDAGTQLADANQNLRAGTNQLARDIMMAGRIIGTEGISMPTGTGISFKRPGPTNLLFDLAADNPDIADATLQMPSISSGYQLGPTVNGSKTDIITIITIDEFMPVLTAPPAVSASPTQFEGTIAPDGSYVTLPTNSIWLTGDTTNDTPKIQVGDLVYLKNSNGNAIQTVTKVDTTKIYFETTNDFFGFNRANATTGNTMPLAVMKQSCGTAATPPPCNAMLSPTDPWYKVTVVGPPATVIQAPTVTLFKALMITYYVDNTTVPGTPRLTRVLNHCPGTATSCPTTPFEPQALAGVVEDLDLSFDLVDGVVNPTNVASMPYTLSGKTYSANLVRKVNIHMGVRSEVKSKPTNDYIRNHITTSVNVRSLSAVDRYVS
jgi:prepilin-type N-terminal cleavage/methylation domain-containing protein